MPQVTINYKKPETLKILKSLAKYLDFQVTPEKKIVKQGVLSTDDNTNRKYKTLADKNIAIEDDPSFVPGDPSIDNIIELREIFSGRNIDAKQLRKDAWTRKR